MVRGLPSPTWSHHTSSSRPSDFADREKVTIDLESELGKLGVLLNSAVDENPTLYEKDSTRKEMKQVRQPGTKHWKLVHDSIVLDMGKRRYYRE
jgi:hypothetical protein